MIQHSSSFDLIICVQCGASVWQEAIQWPQLVQNTLLSFQTSFGYSLRILRNTLPGKQTFVGKHSPFAFLILFLFNQILSPSHVSSLYFKFHSVNPYLRDAHVTSILQEFLYDESLPWFLIFSKVSTILRIHRTLLCLIISQD